MSDESWQNPAAQDPGSADPAEDGRPTPGAPRPWTAEPPGAPEWRQADNADARSSDREREIAATGNGQHGTAPRDFPGDELGGSDTAVAGSDEQAERVSGDADPRPTDEGD